METLVRAPVQHRSRQTLAAIVDAAEALLAERPFAEVAVADIVRRAGCTTGSFYARFSGKEALIPYLYEKYDADLTQRLSSSADLAWETWTLEEALGRLITETVASYGGRIHLMREIMLFARAHPEAIGPEMRARRNELQGMLNSMLARHAGRIRHADPAAAVAFAVFAVSAVARELVLFSHAPMAGSTPMTPETLTRELTRLALAYLTAEVAP